MSNGVEGGSGSASASKNEADPRKMFIGGLHWETTVEELKEYFTQFGAVEDATIKTDMAGTSRGFGFVLFSEEPSVEKVLASPTQLTLKDKKIEAKRASIKEIKKIFVGGLNPKTPEEDIRTHFEQYGEIESVELPMDKEKNSRRGFVFVTFTTVEACNAATAQGLNKQQLGENNVDVKKAVPQKPGSFYGGAPGGGYDPYGYGYYGYPGYGAPPFPGRGAPRGGRGRAMPFPHPYGYDPYAGYDFSQDYGYGYPPAPGGGKMRGRGRARGAPY